MAAFLYLHCTDLGDARRFYTEVVGLSEIFVSIEDGVVGYCVGDLQITIEERPVAEPPASGWARQLGWDGGTSTVPSWGIELDAPSFVRAVDAATTAGTPRHRAEPKWVGYWSFPVRDPMGNTVELSTTDRDAWPADTAPTDPE